MKALIFGVGDIYQRYKHWFDEVDVVGILDNSSDLQGKCIDGHIVVNPKYIMNFDFDCIYILSTYVSEMEKQLLELGVDAYKIFYIFDLSNLNKNCIFYKHYKSRKLNRNCVKRAILISHELSFSGAPNCLLYVAFFLRKDGYYVRIGSPQDGPMRELFLDIGADVVIDNRLAVSRGEQIDWLYDCDVLFFNTVSTYHLLMDKKHSIPAIWWLHEPPSLYKTVTEKFLERIQPHNLKIYTVSDVADRAFHDKCPFLMTKRLLFGIPDVFASNRHTKPAMRNLVVFIIVGVISRLKGHDILLEAIENLSDDIVKRCKFICIGENDDEFAKTFMQKASEKQLPVFCPGSRPHDEVLEFMESSDVHICSSREETVSMGTVEAMMKALPSIVPNQIGISPFLRNGENGYLFAQNDASSLSNCICSCVRNKEKLFDMGNKARMTYLSCFSIDRFYEALRDVFKEESG